LFSAHVEAARLGDYLHDPAAYPLGIVSYGAAIEPTIVSRCPTLAVDLPPLFGEPMAEVWVSRRPVSFRDEDGLQLASNGELLMLAMQLPGSDETGLDELAYSAYRRLLERARLAGFPHLLRAWNYFPGINEPQGGLERYRQFCIGRHRAFSEAHANFRQALPAASAVGTRSGPLQVQILASPRPGLHFENPRQVSAYNYPEAYGPRSPAFARATLDASELGGTLYIAGTASIVGHASEHVGDPTAQTLEVERNLDALLSHIRQGTASAGRRVARWNSLKVYVRDPAHAMLVREHLQPWLPSEARVMYLQGDICRRELLVEVEGVLHWQ
jgi:chorismate lyase/3-hydroxybenzoate synthase